RRRHTRSTRDWSSDVCSSDLFASLGVTVSAGSSLPLTATPKDANGNPLVGRTVTWQSSNTSAATVNGSGLVSGVAAGSATITARSGERRVGEEGRYGRTRVAD